MTVGHLLFAAMTTAISSPASFSKSDLVAQFGDDDRRYRERVAMLVPFLGGSAEGEVTP